MKNETVSSSYKSIKMILSWKNPNLQESIIEKQIEKIKSNDLRRENYACNYQLEIKRRLTDLCKAERLTISLDELKQFLDKNSPGYTFTFKELERLTGRSGLRLETKSQYGASILNIPCIFEFSDWYEGESLFLPINYYSEEYLIQQVKFDRNRIDQFNQHISDEIAKLGKKKEFENTGCFQGKL